MSHFRLIFCRHLSTLNLRCKLVYSQITSKLRRAVPQKFYLMSLKIMLNIGHQFQYSDRLIENSNPQKITFSEVLRGALPVLSWQPIPLFISEHISSFSAYIWLIWGEHGHSDKQMIANQCQKIAPHIKLRSCTYYITGVFMLTQVHQRNRNFFHTTSKDLSSFNLLL